MNLPTQSFFRALNRVVRPAVKAGLGSPLPVGLGLVTVENTGRVSGRTYEVPLVSARLGDRVVATTVRPASQWLRNLESEPASAVWMWGRRRPALATVTRGPVAVASFDLG